VVGDRLAMIEADEYANAFKAGRAVQGLAGSTVWWRLGESVAGGLLRLTRAVQFYCGGQSIYPCGHAVERKTRHLIHIG
jgi:hypothetical protein